MKKIVIGILLSLIYGGLIQAQVSGTYSIPGATYPTIASAISALNATGVGTGGVTFNVAAGYTETFTNPLSGYITTVSGTSSNQIVFQKSGSGANPLVTAATGTGTMDAVFAIAGCDYVTFNGIDAIENPANVTPVTQMEWGFAILKASATDGSQYTTIKNCSVSLVNTYTASAGIYSDNFTTTSVTQLVITGFQGTNSYNKFYSNTLNCYTGIYVNGYNDPNIPYAYYDQFNEIGVSGPNTITHVAGGASNGYGIYTRYQNGHKIANNVITSTTGAGAGTAYGIYNTTSNNASYDLYGNSVSIQYSGTGTSNLYAIYSDAGANSNTNIMNIYNNTVSNCTFPTMTSGTFYGIYLNNLAVTTQVYNNVVSNNTIGSAAVTGVGQFRGLTCTKAGNLLGPIDIHDNLVTGNTRLQLTQGSGLTYYFNIGGTCSVMNLYNNTASNNSSVGTGGGYGIYMTMTGWSNIYNNSIINISNAEGSFYGIYNSAFGGKTYLYRNKIQNIEGLTSTSSIYGIYNSVSGVDCYLYNNSICDFRNPASTSLTGQVGIMINAASIAGLYYNTIYLKGQSTGTNYGTAAVYTTSGAILDFRNNIMVNTSTANGTGKTVALRFSSTTLTNYQPMSNYNDLYAGTPSASSLIFWDGTNSDQTLAAYQARMAPRELQSITELPPFASNVAGTMDMHLKTTSATQCESGGFPVATPININTDYDLTARYPNPGYPVNAGFTPGAPDLGAYEFGGLNSDITPPAITYTPLANTALFTARTLTVTMTDGNGVPTTGAGLPMLYWKINSGTYTGVQAVYLSPNTYSFTFGGGVTLGDVVSYYIVAQDKVATPNVGGFPFGGSGFTANPPACSTPPATPSTYTIGAGLSGVFHVGVGKNYATLTAAIADVNAKIISGPVTLLLDDPTYAAETYPIVLNPNAGSSAVNTLTIKPNAGNSAVFSASTTTALLNINGFDYLIIDGSNAGTNSQNLTIQNANTSFNTNAISFSCFSNLDPATNCTIKNSIIKCLPVNASGGNTAINFVGTGGGYRDNLITNNTINACFSGISLAGTTTNPARRNVISNNVFGSTVTTDYLSRQGVYITYADSTMILNNEIMGPGDGSSLNTGQTGVFMSTGATSTKIRNNKIHDFARTADDGWGASGIWYSSDNSSVTEISNNLIYNIHSPGINPGVGQNITYGIFVRSGGNLKIWHNTINLYGSYLSWGWDASSACLALYYQATGGGFDVRDNIFRNGSTEMAGGNSLYGKAYGIMISVPPQSFTALNNNDYWIDGYNGTIGEYYQNGTGFILEFPTLASWQTYTGQEFNSKNIDPVFTSNTNVIPTTTNAAMQHAGVFIPTVPLDYAGATRTNPPDIGAYEFTLNPLVVTTSSSSVTNISATLNGTINANLMFVSSNFEYGLTTAYGTSVAAVPATVSGNVNTPISFGASGLQPLTTYHYRAKGITSQNVSVYGADMTFTTLPNPPAVITTAATSINSSGATLNGTVNANGGSATVTFQYGLTTAYGSTITAVQSPVSGSIITNVNGSVSGLLPFNTYHYRVVSTNAGGTTYGNDMTFTTSAILASVVTNLASNITATTGQINGTVNPNYAPTTASFEWGLTTSYGNTVAATPASVTGNTATPVLATLTGLSWNTTYHYRIVGVNAAGTAYGADMTFNTSCPVPATPATITGPASICQNTSGVAYSVPAITNATNYNWTVPTGATVVSGAGTNAITVNYSTSAVSGNITVTGTNFCSTGPTGTLPVTVNVLPVPTISGPAVVCNQSAGNVYSTQAGMTGYTWTVSAGGTITAGAGTSAVTVTWTTTGAKTVSVNYSNANGCSAAAPVVYNVSVNALPSPTITGTTTMCAGSGYYTYTTEAGQSNYSWSVSSGGSIFAGQGTNTLTVSWNSAGAQTVSVNYSNANGCQAITPTLLNVTVNGVPAAAGTISGPTGVCAGTQGAVYSVAPVAGALAYAWTVPTGATIVSGANTSSITVNYAANAASGQVTVSGNNLCGNGSASSLGVSINPVPAAAGTITGPASVCKGDAGVVYTVPPVLNATSYTWTVPAGATITAGSSTNSITVTFGATSVSGNVTVYGANTCGNGTPATLSVAVNAIPPTPTITANGYVLTSSAANGNQWYHDGIAVSGATSQTYTVPATAPGWYWTIVTLTGCSSDSSNHLYIQGVGIGEHNSGNVNIYPVPNNGSFSIAFSSEREISYTLEVFNSLGVKVYGGHTITVAGTLVTPVDLGDVPAGLYTVILRNANNQVIRKILVNN